MTERIRVGVVGVGAIAQVAHLPALAGREDVAIAAVCDNDVSKARALASRFDVHDVYDDIEDLLRYTRPDAVVICTPNHLHEIHVETALSAGAAVLCERPLALHAEGVERIREVARRAGRPVMVGMNHRYRSDVQAVRAFVTSGELGALRGIRTGWYMFRTSRAELGWRQRRQQSGGGAMLDLGLSLVDLGLWLAGCPEEMQVTAAFGQQEGARVEDSACALITCGGGLSIFVDVAWRYVGDAERFWLDVMGEKGSARIAPLRVFKELHGAAMNVTPTGAASRENLFSASYRAEWARFLAMVRGEVEPPTLDDQVALHRTLDAIYRSAREGHAVDV